MALVTCPDCKKECSDQAPTCPSCGRPMKKSSIFTQNLGFAGFLYFILLLFGVLAGLQGVIVGWAMAAIGGLLLWVRTKIWIKVR